MLTARTLARACALVASLALGALLVGCGERVTDGEGADTANTASPSALVPDPSLPALPIEEIGRVLTLPDAYPEHWLFVDEASFSSMFGGKMILLDVANKHPPSRIKGTADKNLLGNFTQAKTRREFYIVETFHERGARGPRTDVLTIYDKRTLSPIKEIVWDGLRLTALPERYAMAVSKEDRFLYVSNFSPAASFSVVDLDRHEVVDKIETPGCVLTYPVGERSVGSLCSDGGFLTVVLDATGRLESRHRMAPFFDTDKTPIFERPAIIDGMAYFPGFRGAMHMLDLRGAVASYAGSWSMLSEQQRAANWRPGGLGLIDHDEQGLLYVIMHPDGFNGSQGHGGPEVWVYDVARKQRIGVVKTPNWAISITLTRGESPLLVATNGELNLDVYDVADGSLLHTISDFGNVTPLLMHKAY